MRAPTKAARATVELHPARAHLLIFVVVAVVFLALGGALLSGMLRHPPGVTDSTPTGARYGGVVFLLVGAGILLAFLPLLFRPRATVVADDAGLHDRSRFGSAGSFAWSEIEALGYTRSGKHGALGVWLRDPARFIRSRRFWIRPILHLRARFGRPVACVVVLTGRRAIRRFAAETGRAFGVAVRD